MPLRAVKINVSTNITDRRGKGWSCRADLLGESEGTFPCLTRSNAHRVLYRRGEHLAVAYFARLGCFNKSTYCAVFVVVLNDDFDFYLGHEVDAVFSAAIDFAMAALATKPANFSNRHTDDADFSWGFARLPVRKDAGMLQS